MWWSGWIALALGVITLIVTGAWLTAKVLAVKSSLQSAQSELVTFKSAIGQAGGPRLALHPDGARLALGLGDGSVLLRNLATGKDVVWVALH